MTAFTTLVADVYTITNRPDLVAETALAVKAATIQLHRQDFFFKDLHETAIVYDTAGYLQTIEYRLLFPNYRAMSYLRKFDPTAATADEQVGVFFKAKTPQQVLDSYSVPLADIYYVAGNVIQVRSSTEISYSLIGVYLNPIVATPETYSSWISDEAPFAVVFAAAALVFGSVLKDTRAQQANNSLAQIEFAEVKNSNIIAEGS